MAAYEDDLELLEALPIAAEASLQFMRESCGWLSPRHAAAGQEDSSEDSGVMSLASSLTSRPSVSSELALTGRLRGPLCATASMFIPVAPTRCALDQDERRPARCRPERQTSIVSALRDSIQQTLALRAETTSEDASMPDSSPTRVKSEPCVVKAEPYIKAEPGSDASCRGSPEPEAKPKVSGGSFVFRKQYLAAQPASSSEGRTSSLELKSVRFKDAIRNARQVERQRVPSHSGNWRGCKKSPWCDRETSHRGMCNRKAGVPGTAAWTGPPFVEVQRLSPGKHTFASFIDPETPSSACEESGQEEASEASTAHGDTPHGSSASLLALGLDMEPGQAPSSPSGGSRGDTLGSLLQHMDTQDGECLLMPAHLTDICCHEEMDTLDPQEQPVQELLDGLMHLPTGGRPDLPPIGSEAFHDLQLAPLGSELYCEFQEAVGQLMPGPFLEVEEEPDTPSWPLKRKAAEPPDEPTCCSPAPEPATPGVARGRHARKKTTPARLEGAQLVLTRSPRTPKAAPVTPPAPKPPSPSVVLGQHECTQCHAQATPVWRAGPKGPKTLCNACGVRWQKDNKGRRTR